MAISLPFSVFTTSVAQFILVLNWLIQFNISINGTGLIKQKAYGFFLLLL